MIAVEIISKDQNYTEMLQKLDDYEAWGVPNIWIIDPRRRRLSIFANGDQKTVDALRFPEAGFEVRIDQLLEDVPPEAF